MSKRLAQSAVAVATAAMFSAVLAADQRATPAGPEAARGSADPKATLRTPAKLTETAPDLYRVRFDTTKGVFVVEVHRDWAPIGADRFYNLVKNEFYDGTRFFRVLSGFMAQFGMNGDPSIQSVWTTANIKDDPVKESNLRGYVTFAKAPVPHSRSTQISINYQDNSRLDADGFAPFGQVVSGMEVVDMLYSGYGRANIPDQLQITKQGEAYLKSEYPLLDTIKAATIKR